MKTNKNVDNCNNCTGLILREPEIDHNSRKNWGDLATINQRFNGATFNDTKIQCL